MKGLFIALFLLSALSFFAGCAEKDYLVVIKTPHGDMKAVLYDDTPQHKENFLALVRNKSYDNTIFHRVIEEFMIQGGDVNQKGDASKGTSIDYTLPAEIRPHYHHVKGALSAARQGDQVNPDKESSGCQFYIVQGKVWDENALRVDRQQLQEGLYRLIESDGEKYAPLGEEIKVLYISGDREAYDQKMMELVPIVESELGMDLSSGISEDRLGVYTSIGGTPHLDGEYTVFGKVVEGLDVIDKIAAVEAGQGDRPKEDVAMTMELEEVDKAMIAEKYGIVYRAAPAANEGAAGE